MLAAEGIFALTLPLVIGPWSDTFHTPLGRRRPFMAAAIGPMAFALALLAFMPNLWTTALMLCALFFAYYVYEPPYRGLYPDVLPEQVFGRAQGVQHVFRGIAIGGALIGGGYLFHLWRPAPFLAASAVVAVACLVPILFVTEDGGQGRVFEGVRTYVAHSWRVLRSDRDVATFLVANTAWEGTFAGARTFVVLYVTVGLGEPLSTSTYILAAVAGGYIVAALVAGRIGDRVGLARVIIVASVVYGTGLVAGGLGREWHAWYLVLIFLVAIAGGTVMTLAWGLLFKLMPSDERGAISGLATTTKGVGLVIGPLVAGGVIDLFELPPRGDRRLPGALAGARSADPARDPARRAAHPGRGGGGPCSRAPAESEPVSARRLSARRRPRVVSPGRRRSRPSAPARRRACAPRACPRRSGPTRGCSCGGSPGTRA